MATSKRSTTPVEETLDTTPDVVDFVETTPTEETSLDVVIENTSAIATVTDGNTSVSNYDETGALTTRSWHK
jgi:hypothetical protein